MSACCFTGHRVLSREEQRLLIPKLTNEIEKLIAKGVTVFRNGGALGFDLLAALCVLRLKDKYPELELYIDVPHKGQADRWNPKQQDLYRSILARADRVSCLSEHYYQGCMHTRNRHMVDRSSYVIAYVRRMDGGAFYTVNYAEAKNKEVIYL